MQSRFAIVLMSIAGAAVLFGIGFALGLGVLSSPAPEQHKQIAVTTQPTKVVRPETTGQAKAEDRPAANQKTAGNDRALTPLYPVAPGGTAEQRKGEKSEPAAAGPVAPPPQQQAKADEPARPAATANADAPAAPAPKNATPVSLERSNACDVSACARAYKSFRESDCTYQPYSGPRQLCVKPPGAREAARSHGGDRAASRDVADQRDVDRGNARATDGRGRGSDREDGPVLRRYHRDFTADGEDDRIVVVPADEGAVVGADDYDDDQ